MITITPAAQAKVSSILKEEEGVEALRIFVQGGGCSGFQYGFTLAEKPDDDDLILEFDDGLKVVVDPMSLMYLDGANVDYKESLMGAQFVLDNPNVKASCGCGSSFTID